MSHELRTPLAAILGFSELLATRDLGEKPDEWGRMIHVAGKHLLTLVDEIMDLSRIEAGTVGISTEAVSLRPLVEEAFQLMRPVAAGHDITLFEPVFMEATGAVYVLADRRRLTPVVISLISNAIKCNRHRGTVTVEAEEADGRIRLSAADTGAGIDRRPRRAPPPPGDPADPGRDPDRRRDSPGDGEAEAAGRPVVRDEPDRHAPPARARRRACPCRRTRPRLIPQSRVEIDSLIRAASCRNKVPERETHGDHEEERMSTASPTPPAPRPAPAQPARADGPSRHAVWRALFFLLVLVLVLITVWHVADQITKRHAEESFASGQVSLQVARLESRTRLAEARARLAAAEATRDSAVATAGIAAARSLEGSGSKRIQEIFAAITDAISRAGTGSSSTTP